MATHLIPRSPQYLHQAIITDNNHSTVEQLYSAHRDAIFRVAMRVTGNSADAEDILQNVFLRMLRNEAQPDPHRSPGAYLRRAAANASIDLFRKRAKRSETTSPPNHPAIADPGIERRRIQQAIAKLPPRNAELFELHYRDGYLCEELADRLEMHSGTVKSRLHRIRARLQKQLQAA